MKNTWMVTLATAAVLTVGAFAAKMNGTFAPGTRTLVLAHNAFPDHGKYGDRLERALAAGMPLAIEEDLAWVDGRSLLVHGPKAASGDDPTLDAYFFTKIQPHMEKALQEGNKGNWPLITLYLDIKNDPPEHLEVVNKLLDKYDAWLTKAVKTDDIARQSPLELKPMMVLVEDKQNDIKQSFFYDRVPVGGKIRVFGSATKADGNPGKLPKAEALAKMPTMEPEQLIHGKADNYHRWFGTDWAFLEACGPKHGEWTPAADARLKRFVEYGHKNGYLVSLYSVNGFTETENQGWTAEFNFGSREGALARWQAAQKAHADFIATDQYEDLGKLLRASR